jgi:CelD/BcsL family acetyltransferase involved in cellulose biosynthesis
MWEGRRQLTLLGSGISDYLEPLIAAADRAEILQTLSTHLEGRLDWDVCSWQDLSSPTLLAELPVSVTSMRVMEDMPCTEVPIMGNWEMYCRARPRGLRRNLRRYAEKAYQLAEFQFFAERDFKSQLLETLICLHTARWRRQGEAGMIAANCSADFLREVVPKLAAQGHVLFFGLEFQGRTVALILSFPYQNVLFSYLSGFDPEYEQYGFGRLLLHKSLEYAFAKKFKSWNFLRGNEPYKFEWGATLVPKTRLLISRQLR